MTDPLDTLMALRRLILRQSAAEMMDAAARARVSQDALDSCRQRLHSMVAKRDSISGLLCGPGSAGWLARLWARDSLLASDVAEVKKDLEKATGRLREDRSKLFEKQTELGAAMARLSAADKLQRKRRAAVSRRREHLREELVLDFLRFRNPWCPESGHGVW